MVHLKKIILQFHLFLFCLLLGCSSGNKKERDKLRELYSQGKYTESLAVLESGEIKKDKHSKLLYLLDKGKLYHSMGHYEVSSNFFQDAQELIKQFYTKSISQAAGTYISNDNYRDYDGELFERSLSFFYQSLNFLLMYQTGKGSRLNQKGELETYDLNDKQKRDSLFKARAQILAWDSFFQDIQRSTRYDSIYRNDLIVKIYGALVHESIGKSSDDQIALQLYKDAQKVLSYLGNTYPSYNAKEKEFTKKLLKQGAKFNPDAQTNLLAHTANAQDLEKFLKTKIENLSNRKKNNVAIIIQEGLTVGKSARKFNFGLHGALENIEDPKTRQAVHSIGSAVLTLFMMNILGLYPKAGNAQPGDFVYGEALGRVSAEFASIDFEVPEVKNIPVEKQMMVSIYQGTSKVAEVPAVLVAPIDDMASQAVDERVFGTYVKVGTRVAWKHLTAIIAAYAIYKKTKANSELFAKTLAVGSYLAAQRAIAATEKADVRFWSLLPKTLRISDLDLKPGTYQVKILSPNSSTQAIALGPIVVEDKNKNIFSYQVMNF